MLLNVSIGDAYGVGFEFQKMDIVLANNNLTHYYNNRNDDISAGRYSDDTQMSLAIAELMLSGQKWTKKNIARFFLIAFKRDNRQGYAKGFYSFLSHCENEDDFLKNINPFSLRNGAAMRSVPLSFIKNKRKMIRLAAKQAKITHNTKEGILSSKAVALIGHYFLFKNGKKANLKSYLERSLHYTFDDNKSTQTKCDAIDTINAVLTVLMKSDSQSDILINSVALGGDTDSVASISCGLASLSNEYDQYIEPFLLNNLENNLYGKNYILILDKQLKQTYLDL